MPTSTDALDAKISELETTVNEKQAALQASFDAKNAAIAAGQAHIDELQAKLDASATPEQIQASVDKFQTVLDDLKSTDTTGDGTTPPPVTP